MSLTGVSGVTKTIILWKDEESGDDGESRPAKSRPRETHHSDRRTPRPPRSRRDRAARH